MGEIIMKINTLFQVFCFGLLLTFNYPILTAEAKEPQLIKEMKVKGEVKDSRNSDVVLTNDRLQFLDEAGGIKKEMIFPDPERTRVKLSKNGNVIGQTIAHGVSEKGPEKLAFRMFNREGAFLWETDNISIGSLYLSEAKGGSVVGRICHEGACTNKLKLFDKENPQGKVVASTVSSGAESTGGDIAEDGNYFAITFATTMDTFHLLFFDIAGTQLWEYHLSNAWGNEVGVSPQGNFVVATIRENASRDNHIYVFNKQGQIIVKQTLDTWETIISSLAMMKNTLL